MQYQFHGDHWAIFFVVLAAVGLAPVSCLSADEFEKPPIEYSKAAADNCITRLEQQLERGEADFDYRAEDKRAIVEIIRETKDGLPEYWKSADEKS